ncbi:hypothetical protein AUP74_03380 [Microbulbifer aggregans]|uniref:Thiol:disulfide interchange protein n=1 Tax=Microbulbifer aggregans TaxID=1769779 RepID=A0A1C9WC71_9GAMM|nr:thioredoxin family protein [Microbulbifer aggregans]AOS98745.1 hypothetical protein AUP74_03380 [Microbulbifer aggregans]
MKRFLLGLACTLIIAVGAVASDSGRVYLPVDDAMEAVDHTLSTARQHKKRALIIMGANWCHDSRALATSLQSEEVAETVSEAFEIQFVDVGFLEKNFEINRRFGLPVIFGTPTVLAIDPETEQLINRSSLHIWSNAASFSSDEVQEKLIALRNVPLEPLEPIEQREPLASLMAQIDEFERVQAERIYRGFGVVGPMLASYKAGDKPDNFQDYWQQLYEMRSKLPNDLLALRHQAKAQIKSGEEGFSLQFPVYPAFDWEKSPSGD